MQRRHGANETTVHPVGVALLVSLSLHALTGVSVSAARTSSVQVTQFQGFRGVSFDIDVMSGTPDPGGKESQPPAAAQDLPRELPESTGSLDESSRDATVAGAARAQRPAEEGPSDTREATPKTTTGAEPAAAGMAEPEAATGAEQEPGKRATPSSEAESEDTASVRARSPANPFSLPLPGDTGSLPLPADAGRSSSSGTEAQSGTATQPGGYGQAGSDSAVLDLHRAFLKTLPLAAKSDPAWTTLPLGPAGEITVRLTVDSSLRLEPPTPLEGQRPSAPAHLRRLVQQNHRWLTGSRFRVATSRESGTRVLRIVATISQKDPDRDASDAKGTRALGTLAGEPPRGSYWTYFSGRHVELRVEPVTPEGARDSAHLEVDLLD